MLKSLIMVTLFSSIRRKTGLSLASVSGVIRMASWRLVVSVIELLIAIALVCKRIEIITRRIVALSLKMSWLRDCSLRNL